MIASRLPYSGQASLELEKSVDTSKSESLQETSLLSLLSSRFSTTFVSHLQVTCISVLNMITNSQNNTQFTHSLTHSPLKMLEFLVCTQQNSLSLVPIAVQQSVPQPVAPFTPPEMPTTPRGSSCQLGNVQVVTSQL